MRISHRPADNEAVRLIHMFTMYTRSFLQLIKLPFIRLICRQIAEASICSEDWEFGIEATREREWGGEGCDYEVWGTS